jgi:hypothetical protein
MLRALQRSIVVAFGLALVLTGCSAGPLIDKLPPEVGLPKDTPARPDTAYPYPAVHDMPPPRGGVDPLNEEDQVKLENDLKAIRDRQPGRPPEKKDTKEAVKKAATDAKSPQKKKPANADSAQPAGAKPNP